MKSSICFDSESYFNNYGKSILPIPAKKPHLSIPLFKKPVNPLQKPLKSSNSSSSLLSSRTIVNIHRTSSIPKLIQDPNYIPSIVSSVLYLKNRSKEVVCNKIQNFQGGGFRGLIKKSKRFKRLVPSFEVSTDRRHLKTHSQGETFKLLKQKPKFELKLAACTKFHGNILGRQLFKSRRTGSTDEY